MNSVIELTVRNGFCTGCGVCAGICPKHSLVMQWNESGEYNPRLEHECISCGLCVKACPFADDNPNEDEIGDALFSTVSGIHHHLYTGYYLSSYAGAVSDDSQRMQSASGGLATWFLEKLLVTGVVDYVICVGHASGDGCLFSFRIASTVEEIRASRGSAYYPVEISDVLRHIKNTPGKYAVIGLPCLVKGLRLAQKQSKILRERIVCIAGLSCCNMKNTHFTKYAAYQSGSTEEILWASYRSKSRSQNDLYQFQFQFQSGKYTKMRWNKRIWDMYVSWCCTLPSCDFCDDMFAECADITFMDAWLPEYSGDARGTSIWICRNQNVEDIILDGLKAGELEADELPVSRVIKSQTSTRYKKELINYRMWRFEKEGRYHPVKREAVGWGSATFLEREDCRYRMRVLKESREVCKEGSEILERWFTDVSRERSCVFVVLRRVDVILHGLRRRLQKRRCNYLL